MGSKLQTTIVLLGLAGLLAVSYCLGYSAGKDRTSLESYEICKKAEELTNQAVEMQIEAARDAAQAKLEVLQLKAKLEKSEKSAEEIKKRYEEQIKSFNTYTVTELDEFFRKRYSSDSNITR